MFQIFVFASSKFTLYTSGRPGERDIKWRTNWTCQQDVDDAHEFLRINFLLSTHKFLFLFSIFC